MSEYTRERIEAVMRAKGYAFFTEGDYNLNLLAVRSGREATNLFDDTFLAVFKVDGAWETREYACTTDPGTYWLRNGLEKGTAVLAPGQYRGAFALGKHKGEYEALVQAAPVTGTRTMRWIMWLPKRGCSASIYIGPTGTGYPSTWTSGLRAAWSLRARMRSTT